MARRGTVLSLLLILVGMFPHPAEGLRPFLSASDAPVVDPGAVEVELGFMIARNTRGDNNQTGALLPSVVFNVGIADRFEFDIATGFALVRDNVQEETLGSATNTSLTLKTLWWEGKDGAPSIAIEPGLILPTARKEFQPNGARMISGSIRFTQRIETTLSIFVVRPLPIRKILSLSIGW